MKLGTMIITAMTLSLAVVAAAANQQTLTGSVTDSMCGKKHMMKNETAAQCTRECAKAGSEYALVVGDKVYTLKGDKTQIDRFAGSQATVTGEVAGETITATSITGAKQPNK